VFHPAELADDQSLEGNLQLLVANVFFFAGLQTLGGAFVGGCNCAVFGNVFLNFLVGFRYRKRSCLRKKDKG